MKSYFGASAVAALACVYVVFGTDAPAPAAPSAAQAALATPWPAVAHPMARQPECLWLLRAMSVAGRAGTLAPSPCKLPADTQSL